MAYVSNFTNLKNRAGLVGAFVLSLLGAATLASATTTNAKLSATDSQGGIVTAATLNNGTAVRVVSRDSAGNVRWTKNIDYQDLGSSVAQIAVDASDNVYVAGRHAVSQTNARPFLQKLSATSGATLLDSSPAIGGFYYTVGVALDTNGNAFELTFDNSVYNRSYLLLKYTPSGNLSSAGVSTSSVGASFINDIVVSRPSNVVLMAGTVQGNSTPTYGETIAFTTGLVQAWTEVDPILRTAEEKGLAADAQGNAYVVYSSQSTAYNGRSTYVDEIREIDHDSGGVVWATGLGTDPSNVGDDASAGLILDASGNLAFGGVGVETSGAVHTYLARFSGSGALLTNAYANVTNDYAPTGLCQDARGDYDVIGYYGNGSAGPAVFVPSFSGNAASGPLGSYFFYYQCQPNSNPFYPSAIVPTGTPQSFFFAGLIGTSQIAQGMFNGSPGNLFKN